jgi:hypothetical protein
VHILENKESRRKRRKGGHGGSFLLSHQLLRAVKQPSSREMEPWRRHHGRNLPQRATPRAGSLGRCASAVRTVTGGCIQGTHNKALVVGGGAGHSLEPLIPRQEQASFLPYNLGADRKTDLGRKRDASPDSDGLFLEMGRVFSITTISVPPALPISVPVNTALKEFPPFRAAFVVYRGSQKQPPPRCGMAVT